MFPSASPRGRAASIRKSLGALCAALALLLSAAGCGGGEEELPAPQSGAAQTPQVSDMTPRDRMIAALPESVAGVAVYEDLGATLRNLDQTAFGQAWNDPELADWRANSWPRIMAAFERNTGAPPEEWERRLTGAAVVFLAFPVDETRSRPLPETTFGVLMHPDENAEEAAAFFTERIETGRLPVSVFQREGFLLILPKNSLLDESALRLRLADDAPEPTAAGRRFAALLDGEDEVHLCFDVAKFVGLLRRHHEGSRNRQKLESVLAESGLGALDNVYLHGGVEGPGLHWKHELRFNATLSGAMTLLGKGAPSEAVRVVPAEQTAFLALRTAPPAELLAYMKQKVLEQDGGDPTDWNRAMMQGGAFFGMQDFEKQFPAMLGDEIAVSIGKMPAAGVMGMMMGATALPVAAYLEVEDAERFEQCVENLCIALGRQPREVSYGDASYRLLDGAELFGMPSVQICWAHVGGFTAAAASEKEMRRILDAQTEGTVLADSPDWTGALQRLEDPEGFLTLFFDPRDAVKQAAPMLAMQALQDMDAPEGEAPFTVRDIPNLDVVMKYQQPAVVVVDRRERALVGESFSTALFLGDPSTLPLLGFAAVAPEFIGAQTQARTHRAQSDMRSIGTAVEAYNIDYGAYPPAAPEYRAPAALTTPISYLLELGEDPFAPNGGTYRYMTADDWWIAASAGPDGDYDLDFPALEAEDSDLDALLLQAEYDPTNGTASNGDILSIRD